MTSAEWDPDQHGEPLPEAVRQTVRSLGLAAAASAALVVCWLAAECVSARLWWVWPFGILAPAAGLMWWARRYLRPRSVLWPLAFGWERRSRSAAF